jgi:ubiquinone/menaquinone biosynthesis C-methylase UbiE
MPLSRVLEVEVMDTAAEAEDYNSMDHSAVNAVFAKDLLATGVFSDREMSVLDLGTGTALIPIEVCRRTPHCCVLAVDLAAHMLELARNNVAAAGLGSRIELQQIDAKALPFSDGRFDVVMSNSIIHHIPEPMHSLREAARVAKSGGLLFFRDLLRPEDETTLTRLVQTYAGNENAHSQQMFADSLHAALSLPEIRGLVSQLGFPVDSVQQTSDRHWTWIGNKVR